MRLTTKGRFAVTAMIDLVRNQDKGPVSLAGISERQRISIAYLEQLFSKLRRRNIVKSVRGPGGGYLLAKEMKSISVADIIFAVDEPLDVTYCDAAGSCQSAIASNCAECVTHNLWTSLHERIIDYLASISLAELAKPDGMNLEKQVKLRKHDELAHNHM